MTTAQAKQVEVARTLLKNFVAAFTQSAKLLSEVSDEASIRKAIDHLDKSSGLLHLGIVQLEKAAGYSPYKKAA